MRTPIRSSSLAVTFVGFFVSSVGCGDPNVDPVTTTTATLTASQSYPVSYTHLTLPTKA